MGATDRLDNFQRRHHTAAFPLAVLYKFVDDSGSYLSALIAYYGFVSLFPLLLLFSTILGLILPGDPSLQHRVVSSALSQFPVVGRQLSDPKHIGGGAAGLAVGIVGSLYGALGVGQALQYAMNTAWRVPRNSRPNPLKARGRSLILLATGGLTILATTGLSAASTAGAGSLGPIARIAGVMASVALNVTVFVFVFHVATARSVTVRDVAPGAVAAAIAWQLLQTFGVLYVGHVVKHASDTNGVFSFVLGLVAFLYLAALTTVICSEINVVRVDRLHPRSLLTPFTDDVSLTTGDRRAYTAQAEAQRMKGFQEVDVTFDDPTNRHDP